MVQVTSLYESFWAKTKNMILIFLPLLHVVKIVLSLYTWVILGSVILNWLFVLRILNPYNQFVLIINTFFQRLTEPLLKPLRRILPSLGGFDLSPLVLLLGIIFLSDFIARLQFLLNAE